MDHVLDLVVAAQVLAAAAQRLDLIALAVIARGARRRRALAVAILVGMVLGGVERLGRTVGVEAFDRFLVDLPPAMLVVGILAVVVVLVGDVECGLGLLAQQRLAILLRDLVVIGVDLGKGQEAVAVAAELDEGGLERRLHARHLGEIDVALELPALGGFEIELLDPVTRENRDARLFRVARVDEHTLCHG